MFLLKVILLSQPFKEIHHYHYIPYFTPWQSNYYPYVWHGIIPPNYVQPNWYYQPTITTAKGTNIDNYGKNDKYIYTVKSNIGE